MDLFTSFFLGLGPPTIRNPSITFLKTYFHILVQLVLIRLKPISNLLVFLLVDCVLCTCVCVVCE